MRKLSVFVFMILIALAFNPAQAQGTYPSKPVVIVVPQPAESGIVYAFSRALAQVLAPRLGQAVSIRNLLGPSKMEFVGKEPADGYTILLSDSTMNLPSGLYTPVAPLAVHTDTSAWIGMSLPAATPKDVVDKLNAMVNAILKQPEFAEKLAKQSLKPTGGTPEDLAGLIRQTDSIKKDIGVGIASRQEPARKTTETPPSVGRYEGDLVEGVRQGKGTLDFPSGARYEGDFVGGLRQGHGVMTYITGARYVGNWVDNWPHGKGTITYANGQRYEGDWVRDVKQGKGIYTWPSGQRYEGEFAGNEYAGYGVMTYANGDRFAGKWVEGKRTGDIEIAQGKQAQQREAQPSSSDSFLGRAVSLLGSSVIGGRGNPAAAVQGKAATEFVKDSMKEHTDNADGFQWGKAAALLGGSAAGGLGKLSPELQGKVIAGILKDSAGGQTGISNFNSAAQSNQRNSQATGAAAGVSAGAATASNSGGSGQFFVYSRQSREEACELSMRRTKENGQDITGTCSCNTLNGSNNCRAEVRSASSASTASSALSPAVTAAAQACPKEYSGPNDDPQFDSLCKLAQINQCLDRVTSATTYAAQTQAACNTLDQMLRKTKGGRAANYCSYCK